MAYWAELFSRAWGDTWGLVVEKTVGSIIVAGVLLAIEVWYWRRQGVDRVKETFHALRHTVAILAVGFLLIFLVNLLILTPKRLVEEANTARDAAEKALADRLQELNDHGPILYRDSVEFLASGEDEWKYKLVIKLVNGGPVAALDTEVLSCLAAEDSARPDGFRVLSNENSASGDLPPQKAAEIKTRFNVVKQQMPGASSNPAMFLFVAAKYKHPMTGKIYVHVPILERVVFDPDSKTPIVFFPVKVKERDAIVKLFAPLYEAFRSDLPPAR